MGVPLFGQEHVVRTSGLEVAYKRVGRGPPLVLVHGAAEDGRIWQPQLDALADEFTVIAWDEPGAGRSSDVPPEFGLADYAHCLAALIEALALGRHMSPGCPGAAPSPRSSTATTRDSSRR
jgi:pimeloyl-ACP methyl ester carboxylesterase